MRLSGLFTLLLLAACTKAPPSTTLTTEPIDFTLPTYPGKESFSLASERGHVVMLDVWATWCEPCRDSLPLYQDVATEFRPRGLEVFLVNVDADSRPIAPFLAETKVSLPVLLDPEARLAEATLKVKLMPTTLLIDKKGLVRFVHEGFDEGQLGSLLAEVETLLAEPAP